jgi:hypothetical protein
MSLPDSVKEIADVIGRDQALYLIGQLPRCYSPDARYPAARKSTVIMYVPKRLEPNSDLVRILGWKDASRLAREFAGMLIHPPSCADILRQHRDKNIVRLASEGISNSMLADWFSLDVSQVRRIIRATAGNPPRERRAANDDTRASLTNPKRRAHELQKNTAA